MQVMIAMVTAWQMQTEIASAISLKSLGVWMRQPATTLLARRTWLIVFMKRTAMTARATV